MTVAEASGTCKLSKEGVSSEGAFAAAFPLAGTLAFDFPLLALVFRAGAVVTLLSNNEQWSILPKGKCVL